MSTKAPIVGRIPAEIHLHAQKLGVIVETYTETVAGHGVTGRVAWAVGVPVEGSVWTDFATFRSGSASSHENARAELRYALAAIEQSRTSSEEVN